MVSPFSLVIAPSHMDAPEFLNGAMSRITQMASNSGDLGPKYDLNKSLADPMDDIIAKVTYLSQVADEAGRQKILLTLRELSHSIETPRDTMARKNFSELEIATARIACDLDLYNIILQSDRPLTTAELADRTNAAPSLLGRLLRYLASQNDIEEVESDTFTANHITKVLADPGGTGGIYHFWDTIGPAWRALPDWLKEHKYADVTSPDDTPHQKGHNTNLRGFDWAATRPDLYTYSHRYMKVQHKGLSTWLDVYPYQKLAKSVQPNQIFFVDVGGGIGHQCVALREKLMNMPNKIIVQDTADTLEQGIQHPGVEPIVQDFFQPQRCKGASIYYLRNVIHDHGDDRSSVILKHLKEAMGPDSVILIDDMVIPTVGAHWHAMSLDLTMMCGTAALERTKDQWEALVNMAGLKINEIYPYTAIMQNSIIECVPK